MCLEDNYSKLGLPEKTTAELLAYLIGEDLIVYRTDTSYILEYYDRESKYNFKYEASFILDALKGLMVKLYLQEPEEGKKLKEGKDLEEYQKKMLFVLNRC